MSASVVTDSFKIFLFACAEVDSRASNSSYFAKGEGSVYPYFSSTEHRIKDTGEEIAAWWWTRSPNIKDYWNFGNITHEGYYDDGVQSQNKCGVCFGFCV